MNHPPFSFPMCDCLFILTKDVVQDYFEYSPSAEFLLDYIKYAGSQAYACHDLHSKIYEQTKDAQSSYQYICSLIQDGGTVTGPVTFGDEWKDIVFLSGMLSLVLLPKDIIVVMKKEPETAPPINVPLSDVMARLNENGIRQLEMKFIPIKLLVDWIKCFDSKFMERVKAEYEGSY